VVPEAAALTSLGRYPGWSDAFVKKTRQLRQMRVHVIRLADHGQHWWHLYRTAAPHEGSNKKQLDYASEWWTGNPRPSGITTAAVLERGSFDPKASQAELAQAIIVLRHQFAGEIVANSKLLREAPFSLSWFSGEEATVIGATVTALGPGWHRCSVPKDWLTLPRHPAHSP
jgi:hypothetical protein